MKVCIAEKPSVAREIANILGAKNRKDGYFEGAGYAVTWTFGHFCTLKTPDDYQAEWKRWDLNNLPMLPEKFETKVMKDKGVRKQFKIIKELFKKATEVINCGDAGQEGELIQRWVIKHAGYKGQVQRLWISSLTPEAIRDGFQDLKPAGNYDNLFYAGSSRAIGDWLLGMNATRLFTLKYGGYKQVLSIGRVQTPTLAMLVDRFKEIENFVPEPFWELHTTYREVIFQYQKGRFTKQEEAEALLEKVTGNDFTILSFTKKKGKEYPPKLFDLTGLQVHCNKRFGFSADMTLKIVQKLYEQKIVTYPRVDTTYLPNDVYPKIAGILGKMQQYQQFTQSLLGQKIRKSSKVFNDKKVTDHHAIIPTGYEKNLLGNEQKVYDSIARRFIAAFYPDCIVSNTTVIGEVEGEKFKATGKEILEEGWRVLFPRKSKSNQNSDEEEEGKNQAEKENIMPTFTEGESGEHDPKVVQKMTQAPKHYTEATLLRSMETAGKKVDDDELRELMKANGIGRPSTRANIIETLFRRRYIRRQKKLIMATDMGIQLIDRVENDLLKSAELTGLWEKQLREIEEGKFSAGTFIKNMKKMVSDLVVEVRMAKNRSRIVDKNIPLGVSSKNKGQKTPKPPKRKATPASKDLSEIICPKCRKGKLLKGNTAYGCSQYQSGCAFRLPFSFMDKKISEKQLARLLKLGSTVQLKGFKIDGKSVAGKAKFDKDFNLHFEANQKTTAKKETKVPDKILCPKCGVGKVVKGKTAYGCSNWQTGCTWRFNFDDVFKAAKGKKMTKALVLQILTKNA